MIEVSEVAAAVLGGSFRMEPRASSRLGETVLAEDIPIINGSLEIDRGARVPERLTFTVPFEKDGFVWDPADDPDHPLAPYGQRIGMSIGVGIGQGQTEYIDRGEFLIQDATRDGDTVSVAALGLLTYIDEARFVAPFQPTGTFLSTIRDLVEPALTVIDGGLEDRAVPGSMAWDEDRLGALMELLDAWPAEAVVTPEGYLLLTVPEDPTVAVMHLTDGVGGTVMTWGSGVSREGACTVVVARGTAADGTQVQAAAFNVSAASPFRIGAPFNPLPVPRFFESPLLTTQAQCYKAAKTLLLRSLRQTDRLIRCTAVPNPRLEVGDLCTVTGLSLANQKVTVETLTLPLTAADGAMGLTLKVVDDA